MRHGLLTTVALMSLFLTLGLTSYAETIYVYDELNRLKGVEYEDGTVIGYIYDKTGNRLTLIVDSTPPTTTADPPGGIYAPGRTVILKCNDLGG